MCLCEVISNSLLFSVWSSKNLKVHSYGCLLNLFKLVSFFFFSKKESTVVNVGIYTLHLPYDNFALSLEILHQLLCAIHSFLFNWIMLSSFRAA